MKSKIIILASNILALVSLAIFLSFTTKKRISIDGAWSIIEVQTVKSDGHLTSVFPKESVAIFSKNVKA